MNIDQIRGLIEKYRGDLAESDILPRRIDSKKSLMTVTTADFIAHAKFLLEQFPRPEELIVNYKVRENLHTIQNCLIHIGTYTYDDIILHNRSH